MLLDENKRYKIYHTILSMALTWALLVFVDYFYDLRVPILLTATLSLLFSFLAYVFDKNRKNPITYIVLLAILGALALYIWIRDIDLLGWLDGLYEWVLNYNGSDELYVGGYSVFIILIIGFVGSSLLYFSLKSFIIRAIMLGLILIIMIVTSVQTIETPKIAVGTAIFYILNITIELSSKVYNKKAGLDGKKDSVLYLMIICLILALVSSSLPSKKEPIQWVGVRRVYNSIRKQINEWQLDWEVFRGRQSDEFGLSIIGYSEDDKRLGGGGIIKDENVALEISGSNDSKPVYLVGSVSNIYTGNQWLKGQIDQVGGKDEHWLDYMEMIYGLSRIEPEVFMREQLVRRRSFTLEYKNISTKTVFYPLKFSWSNWLEKNKFQSETGNIISSSRINRDKAFEYAFYEMNHRGDTFHRAMIDFNDFSYEDQEEVNIARIEEIEREVFKHSKADSIISEENMYDLLKERSEVIHREYLNLPEELPQRVRDLAYEITRDYNSDYEKLKALEAYLRQYPYTLTPGKTPEGADFVDDFLFEKQKGYCTSFASAMAVMGRSIGIPTRYVEGFIAKFDEKSHGSMYYVRNRSAHAWAEAYIEGFGWLPLESSPPQQSSRYIPWINWRDDSIYGGGIEMPTNNYKPPPVDISPPTQGIPNDLEEPGLGEFAYVIIMIGVAFAIVFILLSLYYWALRRKYRKEFAYADYSKKTYILFGRILRLLNYERIELEPHETILALSDRIGEVYRYSGVIFEDVARIFMRYRYGEEELTKEDYRQVEMFYEGLLGERKKRVSKMRFLVEEFMLLAQRG